MADTIDGVRTQKDDVLVVVHLAGERRRRTSDRGSSQIEEDMKNFNCVMVQAKEISKLGDYFGGLWTDDAQYKIRQAKQRHVLALAYGGELMSALKHVNQYLGGHVSFFSDDFQSFVGSDGVGGTGGQQLTGHSGRCFVVGLDRFCT